LGRIVIELYHTVGIRVGEGLEQNRIHHTEDSCVGSGARRQGDQCGNGEAGIFAKHLE
jgi:hypothetical protein